MQMAGRDFMSVQVPCEGLQPIRLYFIANADEPNAFRALEKRKGIMNRSPGFPAILPGDHHMLKSPVTGL